jgi:hypothetical protein
MSRNYHTHLNVDFIITSEDLIYWLKIADESRTEGHRSYTMYTCMLRHPRHIQHKTISNLEIGYIR